MRSEYRWSGGAKIIGKMCSEYRFVQAARIIERASCKMIILHIASAQKAGTVIRGYFHMSGVTFISARPQHFLVINIFKEIKTNLIRTVNVLPNYEVMTS